jgi:hypothetical protein
MYLGSPLLPEVERIKTFNVIYNHPSAFDDWTISALRALEFPIKSDWTIAFPFHFIFFLLLIPGRYFHEPVSANAIALNDLQSRHSPRQHV